MEELNILEVPRILADTRYPISDRLKLADQFSNTVVKELGPFITDVSRFIDSKEHDKFSRIGSPEDVVYKLFVQPSHILAVITQDDIDAATNEMIAVKDDMVKEMTKTLESLIKTKNMLGV